MPRILNIFLAMAFLVIGGCSRSQIKEPTPPTPDQLAEFSSRTGLKTPSSAKIISYEKVADRDPSYYLILRIKNDDFQSLIDSLSVSNRKIYSKDAPDWVKEFESSQEINKDKNTGYANLSGERIRITTNEGFDKSYIYISSF
jgi:hypothetical protein